MSSQNITYTENNQTITLKYEEFIDKWLSGKIKNPTVIGATFNDLKISAHDDDEDAEENTPNGYKESVHTLTGQFIKCAFNNLKVLDVELSLNLQDSAINNAYMEFGYLKLTGAKNKIISLHTNETDIGLDLQNTEMDDLNLYKCHITGKMNGGTFKFKESKTWLGQYDTLIMENVDFGNTNYDPDYFTQDNLKLINPKMNPQVLADAREFAPHVFDAPKSQKFKSAQELVVDKNKERLVDMGMQLLARMRPDLSEAKRRELAEQKYEQTLAKGRANLDGRYSQEMLSLILGIGGQSHD